MKIIDLVNRRQLFVLSLILVLSMTAGIAIAPRMIWISSETTLQNLYPDYSIAELTEQSGAVLHCKVLSRESARWSCVDSETPNVITTDFVIESLGTDGVSTGDAFVLRLDGGVVSGAKMTAEDNAANILKPGNEYVMFLSVPIDEITLIQYRVDNGIKIFDKYSRLMIGIDSILIPGKVDTNMMESLGGKYKITNSDLENYIIVKSSGVGR